MDVAIGTGDVFSRPTAGGCGYGDPLERDPDRVREDVVDYVSVTRALRDYGVVLHVVDADLAEYTIDAEATVAAHAQMRQQRRGWAAEDSQDVARRFRAGELDALDVVRRHAVILEWGTWEVLPNSTIQFREMFERRSARHWGHMNAGRRIARRMPRVLQAPVTERLPSATARD